MKNKFISITVLIIIIPLMVARNRGYFYHALTNNLYRLELIHEWFSLKPERLQVVDLLNDNIPDYWGIEMWAGARAIYKLDVDAPYAGERSAMIQRTNAQGGVALIQEVSIPPSRRITFSVFAKGVGGAIQIWLGNREVGEWDKNAGWINIPPTKIWKEFSLTLDIPHAINVARIWLRATRIGITEFDQVYVGTETDASSGKNLVLNPDFELDGLDSDPLEWWKEHVNSVSVEDISQDSLSSDLSYQNIHDMITGNFAKIQERAKQLGDQCTSAPEMTSWLLSRADDFERAGGIAAREQIYRLAIQLAPNCPQPYVSLAQLYANNYSTWMSAELYHKASELAGNTPASGRYSFEEGFLRLRYTGELDLAAIAFQRAIEHSGWEASTWHRGAALYYLGQTLEALGDIKESLSIYQRILNCRDCTYYRSYASDRIRVLTPAQP